MSTNVAVKPSLTLKRRLNASPAKVYGAWTDPAQLARWFGPRETNPVQVDADIRIGGHYRIRMRLSDGGEHEVGGVYRELVPNERLVFTWAWLSTPERESLVTVALKSDGAGTLLTLIHEQFFDDAARDRHQAGWTGTLDKLEQYFA